MAEALSKQLSGTFGGQVLGAVIPFRGPSLARPALVPGASHSTTAPKTFFEQ